MRFAISDANIFIDLFAIELIESFFQLNLQLHTTDLVLNELDTAEKEVLMDYVKTGGLIVTTFNDADLEKLKDSIVSSQKLSKPDVSVYQYARTINAMILTSDRRLRNEAETMGFEVHGILWLFEQLISQSIIDKITASTKMRELVLINTWLPKQECIKRIEKWSK